jgi:hypothetical protein
MVGGAATGALVVRRIAQTDAAAVGAIRYSTKRTSFEQSTCEFSTQLLVLCQCSTQCAWLVLLHGFDVTVCGGFATSSL